jgi:hypothetical protein
VDLAAIGPQQPGGVAGGDALAGAAGSDDEADEPGRRDEVDAAQDRPAAEGLVEIAELDRQARPDLFEVVPPDVEPGEVGP